MHVLVVLRVGSSSLAPLVYGPFDSEDEAEREWEGLEGMRSLFGDLLAHHVVPLAPSAPAPAQPPAMAVYDYHRYLPYPAAPVYLYPWIYYNQPYPYRVTWSNWSNGSYVVDGAITP